MEDICKVISRMTGTNVDLIKKLHMEDLGKVTEAFAHFFSPSPSTENESLDS
jgi:hypothetical protein